MKKTVLITAILIFLLLFFACIYFMYPKDKDYVTFKSRTEEIKKSELPYGIAYYDKIPVSVIYDKINKGYKSFNNLYGEDDNLIFGNLKKSYYSNKELLDNDIYNEGFRFNNIIYKNKNVKLVNLDSFNIKRDANYREVYERYLEDLKQLFFTKLLMSHERDEAIEIYREYASMFCDYTDDMSVDYPLYVIKEMQRKLTIK